MVIGRTSSYREFANSLFHECRHLTDHMSLALDMEIGGEPIAYLAGDIGALMSDEIRMFICDCHRHRNDINDELWERKKKIKRKRNPQDGR